MTIQYEPWDEVEVDYELVHELILEQFSGWGGLPLTRGSSAGTDNAIYRLGPELVVRLPRRLRAVEMAERERRWLPHLAPHLPLQVPTLVAVGHPTAEYHYSWAVYRWIDGQTLAEAAQADLYEAAGRLGQFVAALQRVDQSGGPESFRAEPVGSADDEDVRRTILQLAAEGVMQMERATAVWEDAVAAPRWSGPPVWIHGDMFPTNLLSVDGHLRAVIDFGVVGIGDPACDMLPAWTALDAQTRDLFRHEAQVDDDTWTRGRGCALNAGLGAVRVYRKRNPQLAAGGWRAIVDTIADFYR